MILVVVLVVLIIVYKLREYSILKYNAKFTSPVLWVLYENGTVRDDYFTDDWTVRLTGGSLDRKISYKEFMRLKDHVISYTMGNDEDPSVILSYMVYKFYQIDSNVIHGEKITVEELAEFYYSIEMSYKNFHDKIDEHSFAIVANHLDSYICYIRMYEIVVKSDHAILEEDVVAVHHRSCYDKMWFRRMALQYVDTIPDPNPHDFLFKYQDGAVKRLMNV